MERYDNSGLARPVSNTNGCQHNLPLPWSKRGEVVPIACGGALTHEQLLAMKSTEVAARREGEAR